MRNFCCAVALLLAGLMAGCQTQFETRTYHLGSKPKAAFEVMDQITTDEIMQHREAVQRDIPAGGKALVVRVIEEEGVAVVRTTRDGHRRIAAALEALDSQ